MGLIKGALRRPVTVMVCVLAIAFFSVLSITKMKIDIFPKLGLPTIYVAQPYGGLSPAQMEGLITSYYEYHFLYVTGIKYVDSKSIQSVALIKLQFYPGTDMDQALSEVVSYVNRAKAFMPPGTVQPFVVRFDAGSVPVGQLVFRSDTRTLGEIQDIALFKVRPMFAALPGVSAPPPFGGNQRTVVIKADPAKLRAYNLTPEQLIQAVSDGNTITPAGNVRIGNKLFLAPQNSMVDNIQQLTKIPLRLGPGPTVYLGDVATVLNSSDVATGFALVNGKRAVYIPVTKRADASTWSVVQNIKKALPDMQAAIPGDIKVSFEFDQSAYVINSLKSLLIEGGLGALLTGLMVLLFLGDHRSALIVIITIPIALLTAIVFLNLLGQTINIMTLGGLALAVGILVDESTVTIENIHRHMEEGKSKSRAILDACTEIAFPTFLILLSILAVFVPSFFMTGIPKAMFIPLALAVGLSMIASYILSLTFVPIMANWFLKNSLRKPENVKKGRFEKFKERMILWIGHLQKIRKRVILAYLILVFGSLILLYLSIGKEIFPRVNAGQFQLRLRAPTGTRIEQTERITKEVLDIIGKEAGKDKVAITSAFVGTQPPSYPINTIYLWTSGPQEAVILVKLEPTETISLDVLKEKLRKDFSEQLPDVSFSFEPGDLVDRVMNLGSNTPVDVAVLGKNLRQSKAFADRIRANLLKIPYLRDVEYGAPMDYPTLQINYNRERLGQMGLTLSDASKAMVAATASSRFTTPNYWLDRQTGVAYQVQVEFPEYQMNSVAAIQNVPVKSIGDGNIYLRDVATLADTVSVGEYDRYNMQRYVNLTANLQGKDLGSALKEVNRAIRDAGKTPAGLKVMVRGQAELFHDTFSELQRGLLIAIIVIFFMLAANFQSFKISFATISTVPAVVAGSILLLYLTGKTLNIQSFMGMIMAIGVAISNSVLFVTYAERTLKESPDVVLSAKEALKYRLRPILMTSIAMIVGMIPMGAGLGEGGDQTSPLGIAVIGGLLFSIIATSLILPLIYTGIRKTIKTTKVSLDPDDPESNYY